jgi:hypothetical protein
VRTIATGNRTEALVLGAFIDRGLDVFVPFGDGQAFDLAVHLGGSRFLRVQCKTARRRGGCLVFNSRTTDHGKGRLRYDGLADAFGVTGPGGGVFLVPVAEATTFIFSMRVVPTLNNQRKRVRFAADYALERWSVESLIRLASNTNARSGKPELLIA